MAAEGTGTGETVGGCVCGAVEILVPRLGHEISACFCDVCRVWGGGVQMGLDAPAETVEVTGPVKTWPTAIAERAWCDICGTHLWFLYTAGRDAGYLELTPGLFPDAGGGHLARVNYADRAPEGYDMTGPGEIARVPAAQYEAENPHLQSEVRHDGT